ncbi:glycoside hydrolase family 3 protein [Microbispora sp. H10949]|uniref:glycoside hydrolase family 3 protein n=1 Tax=Microbispora sp. H10949 TaxID=2729111 RepID=UPI00287397C7|nr:glycoside hydrolase family 3 protein [Microbispora sp. H10949]
MPGLRQGGVMLAALLVAGCSSGTGAVGAQASRGAAAPVSASAAASSAASVAATPAASSSEASAEGASKGLAERTLASMNLRDKVAQLFTVVVWGPKAGGPSKENQARYGVATPAEVVEKFRPGGVILFDWAGNVSGAGQVAALTTGLREAAREDGGAPLMIGVDQENGIVSRLRALVTKLPGAAQIGATGQTANARDVARVTGEELRALGISLDFAPVADVNVNPRNPVIGPRAYGSDPKKVAPMVGAAVDGFHAAKVASVAKHFPGHGDTSVDSHTGLPVIKHTMSKWRTLDAPPFRTAIAHGVDVVMSAHVVMPQLDPSGDPATLSHRILTGLLRDELGFGGVISTDALDMAGVRKKYGDSEVVVRAVLAGADMLLMPPNLPKAYDAILKAVRSGRISESRIDESVLRILRLKERRGLFGPIRTDPGALRSPEHLKVAARVFAQSR